MTDICPVSRPKEFNGHGTLQWCQKFGDVCYRKDFRNCEYYLKHIEERGELKCKDQ